MKSILLTFLYTFFTFRSIEVIDSQAQYIHTEIRQLTFSSKNHELDNNDNFSYDDKLICYDTRGTYGSGIENCFTIEIVEVSSGKEYLIYAPDKLRMGTQPAPGIGAVSFHPAQYSVVFIHGPEIEDLSKIGIDIGGIYAKNNRRGLIVDFELFNGKICNKVLSWVDYRFTDCKTGIPLGAHSGGTHRHEFSMDGLRIGCTYDDFLHTSYGRTIAFFEPFNNQLFNAKYYFSVILKPTPIERAKLGDLVRAYGDSWINKNGTLRGFIGCVKVDRGFDDFLFLAEIPRNVDIKTAYPGDCENYPTPPQNIRLFRMFDRWSSGIVRGSPDGQRLAFLAKDKKGKTQIFLVDIGNVEESRNKVTVFQLTNFEKGVEDNVRWHPSGSFVFSVSDGAIVAISVDKGENFGKSFILSPIYKKNKPYGIAISRNGKYLAFNRRTPTYNSYGGRVFDSSGKDFSQIFILSLPGELFK